MTTASKDFEDRENFEQPAMRSGTSIAKLPTRGSQLLMISVAGISVIFAITGLCLLEIHAKTPGVRSQQFEFWPPGSTIPRSGAQHSLVIFFHPHCPCSRTTLTEYQKLLPKIQSQVRTVAVLVVPPGLPSDWWNGSLSKLIAETPNLSVIIDTDGHEADLFGIRTSGHALLYNRNGRLLFSGGLTMSRGHEGENAGRAAIDRLVNDPEYASLLTSPLETKVFGCPATSVTVANCSEKQCR